jgi:hypothetical protein
MNVDFIEIGTSDFDTLIQLADDNTIGFSVEPIKFYLDRLPDKPNCQKIQSAIGDYSGVIDIYYLHEDDIVKHCLPNFLRGCNSVNKIHPTALNWVKSKSLDETLFRKESVIVETLYNFFQQNNIRSVKILKLDTEGHDIPILNKFLTDIRSNSDNVKLPDKIIFESNSLTPATDVNQLLNRLFSFCYKVESQGHDTIVIRSI